MIKYYRELIKNLTAKIAGDVRNGKNIDLVLKAYNYWCEQEKDGRGYIFDLYDTADLKYLVSNDLITLDDIVAIYKEGKMFKIVDDDNYIKYVNPSEVSTYLGNNLWDVVECMLKYIGRCGDDSPYNNLYEIYVTEILENNEI